MRALGALRALLRVELRAARRNARRSWLVIGLVTLSVAAMCGGGALFKTASVTTDEMCANWLGAAALGVRTYDALEPNAFAALVPPEARFTGYTRAEATAAFGSKTTELELWGFERGALNGDGLARGLLRLVDGRAPSGVDECALSPSAARELGVALGERLQLEGKPHTVVGLAVRPEELESALAWTELAPGSGTRLWLVDTQSEHPALDADAWFEAGHRTWSRELYVADPPVGHGEEFSERDIFEELVTFVLGGFAFFEAALVMAATFAVGVRRRQREIGLVSANGATVLDVLRALCLGAGALASVGVVLGTALGLGVAFAVAPWLDAWNGRWNGPLEISLPHIVAAALLGPASALAATLLPALGAARLPVSVALSGRRPALVATRAWLALGLVLITLGSVWLVLGVRADDATAAASVLGASIACVLGLGACSPWILAALARRAGALPLAWRLAARDAGRFGARNGPVVTAVLAALALSVLLASLAGSVDGFVAEQNEPVSVGPELGLVHLGLALSLVTSLLVVLLATALADVESEADARVLDAVGADPRTQRNLAGARAAYLALLGALLSAPAGLVPSWGLVKFADARLEFHTPWPQLLVCALGLPLLAFCAAWLTAARRSTN